ncbi:hypothetical protein OUZ56_009506 [Daphnia magna]|uniref:Uncharacterized protein n=1 Tax=Daphnia magna TaxID=35525 RepID=A0ABR0AGL7_9CRUS|nr:hypothetical protein OUZ56_009506 [Daphnia magna]
MSRAAMARPELDNDLATETELLKQRYHKFIKASDQVRWTLQSTNATEEQIEQDYSAVAEVEEEMIVVQALAENKREEYKRQLDAEFQDQQRKDERKREEDRNKLLQDLITQQAFAAQILQQQQAYTQQIQELIAPNQAAVQMAAAAAPVPGSSYTRATINTPSP